MRLLYLTLLLTLICTQSVGGEVHKSVEVFWIPPEVETYVPVTTDNIESAAFKIVRIKNEKQARKVLDLIQESSQELNSKKIRVKIVTADKFYNFDSNGVGISSVGQTVKVDLKNLKRVLCD